MLVICKFALIAGIVSSLFRKDYFPVARPARILDGLRRSTATQTNAFIR